MQGRKKANEVTDYIKYKAHVLKQLGLRNEAAVIDYLRNKTAKAENEIQKEIQCDIVARTLLVDFYNGDMTFVRKE